MFIFNVLSSFLGCTISLGLVFLLVYTNRKKSINRMKGVNTKWKSK